MQFKLTQNKFNQQGTWGAAIENMVCPNADALQRFDQSGYDLCLLEQEYADANTYNANIKQDWYINDKIKTGAHINHADLYERKGYHGYALEQLGHWAPGMQLLYKMINLKPKWGIDISIDYVDSKSNCMELFHFEWDCHNLSNVLEMKETIELAIEEHDWNDVAKTKLLRKDEWAHLDFVGQSAWTTTFLGLPKERFKLVPWRI